MAERARLSRSERRELAKRAPEAARLVGLSVQYVRGRILRGGWRNEAHVRAVARFIGCHFNDLFFTANRSEGGGGRHA